MLFAESFSSTIKITSRCPPVRTAWIAGTASSSPTSKAASPPGERLQQILGSPVDGPIGADRVCEFEAEAEVQAPIVEDVESFRSGLQCVAPWPRV